MSSQAAQAGSEPLQLDPSGTAGRQASPRPLVVLLGDTHFFRLRLSEIVDSADCDVHLLPADTDLAHALRGLERIPGALILPIHSSELHSIEQISEVRSIAAMREVPILGITTLDHSGLDFQHLRSLGVVGLVDKAALPEHVTFRINQLVRTTHERRRFLRVPAFIPVDIDADGIVTTEYAVNVSVGGMGIRSSRALAVSTYLRVQFRTSGNTKRLIRVLGRVLYCKSDPEIAAPNLLSMTFLEVDPPTTALLAAEVERQSARFGEHITWFGDSADQTPGAGPDARAGRQP